MGEIGNGLLYSFPFLVVGFVSDLLFRPTLTLSEAEKVLESSMGRVALLFLAVFLGVWLAAINQNWFMAPFVILKTIVDVGEPLQRIWHRQ